MEGASPQNVIEATWLAEYKKQRLTIANQLVHLNSTLFLLEKIEKFPLELFLPLYDDRVFWHMTKIAFWERCIMIIWRVAIDSDSRTLTIKKLKNNICKHVTDTNIIRKLNKVDFELTELQEKVREVRHNFIAHLNQVWNTNPDPQKVEEFSISSADLRAAVDKLDELFQHLCFNEYHSLWLWAYLESAREREQTDIDKLLDFVVKESYLFNGPENDRDFFYEYTIDNYTDEQLEIVNSYRRKFDKSEIVRPSNKS